MSFLLFLALVAVLIWLFTRNSKKPTNTVDAQLEQRNYDWAQFIANYYPKAETDQERALIQRMISDIALKGLPVLTLETVDGAVAPSPAVIAQRHAVLQSSGLLDAPAQDGVDQQATLIAAPRAAARQYVDNTSLLLYFGAFLFVASVGLFIGFGGLPGTLRTALVLLVSVVLYVGGMWLVAHRATLRQAGLTFVGIGMTIAPFTGLAAYNYLFGQDNGALVWCLTSLLCMAMYVHALVRLREPLIGYVFIFTFLSLFESGISLFTAPLYYFGWGMALVGICLSVYSRYTQRFVVLQEPSRVSAMLFVPLAVLASLLLLPSQGAGQLGVSLLIAAVYYAMIALWTTGSERLGSAIAAQVAGLIGIGAVSYAITPSLADVAAVLFVASAFQTAVITLRSPGSVLWRNAASIALGVQFVSLFLAIERPLVLCVSLLGMALYAGVIAWHQQRPDSYAVSLLAWSASPLVYGYMVAKPGLSAQVVALLLAGALCVHWLAHLYVARVARSDEWRRTLLQTYVIAAVAPVIVSVLAGAWWSMAITAGIALSMMALAANDRNPVWTAIGGIIAGVPLLLFPSGALSAAVFLTVNVFALLYSVAAALWTRHEANRWLSTFFWLVLPVTMGGGALGSEWHAAGYAWAYVFAMIGLVVSRAIARGVVFRSNSVALASLARTASVSYVVGYGIAGVVAVLASLLSSNAQVHTSIILAIIAGTLYVLSRVVEKQVALMAGLPLLVQLIVLSIWRPENGTSGMELYLLVASGLAFCGYAITGGVSAVTQSHQMLRDGALLTAFMAPLAFVCTDRVYWPMPIGALVASALLFDRVRRSTQANREWAGGFVLLTLYWCMSYAGIHALQAYVHVLVALLLAYAYWRSVRGEAAQRDQYLWAALIASTVPLALQALSGVAGGVYGWWLLLEMIAWMLVGMAIGRRFVTMWGLYVAVGAVLYQLRNLGWAALTVLAMFLIGIAIYRLQKSGSQKN